LEELKMNKKRVFFITVLITAVLLCLALFGLKIGNFDIKGANQMRYGIDIRGGVEATYAPRDLGRAPTESELEAAKAIIETRMDAKNITDRDVTIDKSNGKILVRFPWKSDETNFDPQKAVSELGETARLTFRDPQGNIILEGNDVAKSYARINSNGNDPVVVLELSKNGAKKFSEATGRLIGQTINIYMDETLISWPTVGTQITNGSAQIEHLESLETASALANKINSGSLPFSLTANNCNIISPTLGSGALNVMIMAGELAFILVCLFMLVYYRLPGLVACIALTLQVTGQLLALSVPQFTLTLPGIAGLILSVGMGVDANVIVSERIKEEINSGKTLMRAIDTGFERAFSSVFDGNITVIIVAILLMIFGSGSMLSFGYTLLCGVIMNFVAGVTASRLMIRSLANFKSLRRPQFFGARRTAQ
jgi:protein-export SecD/SecF family membrane protein